MMEMKLKRDTTATSMNGVDACKPRAGIRYEMITFTPEMAIDALANLHPKQRNLNRKRVASYELDMRSGNWHEPPYTFDAIAFDEYGRLVNGRHRLQALVNANKTLSFNVFRGVRTPSQLKLPEGDAGQPRTLAFLTDISAHDLSVVKYIATRLFGQTEAMARTSLELVHEEIKDALLDFRMSGRRGASAPMRAAFVFFSMYIDGARSAVDAHGQWLAICNSDFKAMAPCVGNLARIYLVESLHSDNGDQLRDLKFSRTLYALMYPNRNQFRNIPDPITVIRQHMGHIR